MFSLCGKWSVDYKHQSLRWTWEAIISPQEVVIVVIALKVLLVLLSLVEVSRTSSKLCLIAFFILVKA